MKYSTEWLDLFIVHLDLSKFQLGKTENYAMEVKYFIKLSTGLNLLSLPTSA